MRTIVLLCVASLAVAPRPAAAADIAKDTGQLLTAPPGVTLVHRLPAADFKPNMAYQWLDVLLVASGHDAEMYKPRPTVLSRTMAIVLTSVYDAWAAYDAVAVGTRLGGSLRRPAPERTLANKEKAISYAAYRSLLFVYPDDKEFIRDQMRKKGFDPDDAATDPATAQGVGNLAANAVIEYRKHDGANQLGDEPGSSGKPYSDFTGYKPRNKPDEIVDPTLWMPIPFSDGKGGTVSPGFLSPNWGKVKPFALERSDMFRPPPPPRWASDTLNRDIEEVVQVQSALTLEQKTIVEFMREGPHSTGQSGHWLQFAQDVSRRDNHGIDEDAKMFFAVGNAVMDAFIACWEGKRYYDTSRPYWWARLYFKDKKVHAWAGAGKGVVKTAGKNWRPYSPDIFLTPPFPGYISGHATASGAASRTLELFTGSDRFGSIAFQSAGYMTEPDASTAQMQAVEGRPAKEVPKSKEIRLSMPTFTATAEMAAISRLWGGYHIRTDNEEGLILGRKIAMHSWPKYRALFEGAAQAEASIPVNASSVGTPR